MKKFAVAFVAILAIASLADAGPFGIFRGRLFQRSDSCANGQCAPSAQNCPGGVCPVPETFTAEPAEKLLASRKLDSKSFAGALQKHVTGKTLQERKILNIINAPDSPRRDRQLARMERHVRAELNIPSNQAVDWSAIDWPTLIQTILQLLIKLLPLILG